MIELNIPNFGNITVYREGSIWFFSKRKFKFIESVLSEYYEGDTLILKIKSHQLFPIETEILFQNLKRTLKIEKLNWTCNKFLVDNDIVKIKTNPFYIINRKMSKIYYNDELIGRVKLKSRIGADRRIGSIINYEPNIEEEVIYYSTICYLIGCSVYIG